MNSHGSPDELESGPELGSVDPLSVEVALASVVAVGSSVVLVGSRVVPVGTSVVLVGASVVLVELVDVEVLVDASSVSPSVPDVPSIGVLQLEAVPKHKLSDTNVRQ